MSIQAVAWALRQELPPVPKFVLVALCERANGKTGQCWPGIDEVAEAVCLSERSVITYIAALVRNGYVIKQAMRRKNGQKSNNHYWICFDREAAPWVGPGAKVEEMPPAEDDENEAADDVENAESPPDATFADGGHMKPASHGPCATAFTHKDSAEPESFKPEPAPPKRGPIPPEMPHGFDATARGSEQSRLHAAEEARKPKRIFVHEGTRAWIAWQKTRPQGFPSTQAIIEGKACRGWFFPTLFPPETGPPEAQSALSASPPAKTG